MNAEELNPIIRKHALANAVKFEGKANPGAVIGRVIGEVPDVKSEMKSLVIQVSQVIKEISKLSVDDMLKELEQKHPEVLEKKEKEERDLFAFLKIDTSKTVITAFPPGPEKYPHIGHAKACLMNYLIAKQYNGKFILRFEDTNPNLVKAVFYEVLEDNLKWLGVNWDELIYASDHMDMFYQYAEKAILEGNAYMCFCDEEAIKKSRGEGIECACRSHSVEQNIKYWNEFPTYPEGKAILRLKIDLLHQNSTMRDPTIFRVIDTPHARHGTKYKVWPNYDWQNAIMDSYSNVTIRVRSKEFEMRSDLQRYVQQMLGIKVTRTYEFARFNLEGVEASGRVIREKVNSGEYVGWDDPRLTTIVALRRRGFVPEAIKNFVIATGLTKNESTLTWDDLILQNKRILDRTARRFFFLSDYEKITIEESPHQNLKLRSHPDHDEFGYREMEVQDEFLISRKDLEEMKDGELYRFMDCINFRKESGVFRFDSIEYDKFRNQGKRIMHFLPAYNNIDVEILMTDASTLKGVAESAIKTVKVGEIVQFERFGFCRLDGIDKVDGKEVYKFWFTHK